MLAYFRALVSTRAGIIKRNFEILGANFENSLIVSFAIYFTFYLHSKSRRSQTNFEGFCYGPQLKLHLSFQVRAYLPM